ncbi:MAG: tol-pal system YbgF family protein [Candidatus Scalinduaceae bacterium]
MENIENIKEKTHEYLKILNEHWLKISIGIAVIVAVSVPVFLYRQKKNNDFNEVWSRIWRNNYEIVVAQQEGPEKKTETIEGAINEYTFLKNSLSTTNATPWLLLELGNTQYNAKKYDDAIVTYKEFIQRVGNHPLVPIVRQSLGYAYEENGQLKEAIDQFEKIVIDTEATFLKAQAKLDAGRCYEKLGELSAAVAAYKDVIDFLPESHCARMAKYRMEGIK